jgi:hypothetical protein
MMFSDPGTLSRNKASLSFRIAACLKIGVELRYSFRGVVSDRVAETGKEFGQRSFVDRFERECDAERWETPLFFVS